MITQRQCFNLAEFIAQLHELRDTGELWIFGVAPIKVDYQEEVSDEARIVISHIGEILQAVSQDPFAAIFSGTNQRFSPKEIEYIFGLAKQFIF